MKGSILDIRIHGRGGQGVVLASQILAAALFKEGKHVQAFPAFGLERRGAPVTAYVRVDNNKIRLRCYIYKPDYVVVFDSKLLDIVDVTAGLKKRRWVIINSNKEPGYFRLSSSFKVATVNANSIALKYNLGSKMSPIVNTAMLGAFSKVTGIVSINNIINAIGEMTNKKVNENAGAAKEAYNHVLI